MGEDEDGPPVVSLPERLDRRLRLGPFPSARDALKFVLYASAGALLAPFVSPLLWLPVLGGGFLVAVWRPDGEALDERAVAFGLWKLRSMRRDGTMSGRPLGPAVRRKLVRLGPSRYAAVIRTGGTPIAYLPPVELARHFESFRELLRSSDGSFALSAAGIPLRTAAFLPRPSDRDGADREARLGYTDLVGLLGRRRSVRRVYLTLVTEGTGPEALGRLEARVATFLERLGALGVRPVRLCDRALADAVRLWGWPEEGAGR